MNRDGIARRMPFVAPLLALMAGCVGADLNPLASSPPPPGAPCQVVATWRPELYFPPDPVHAGAETPTLAGRVYLFGPEIKDPMPAEGTLTVAAYDCGVQVAPGVVPIKAWMFDPVTLQRLLKKDMIGWAYTVPLPWPEMPPTLGRVQLKVCFQPTKGTPLYSECSTLSINNPMAPVVVESAKPHG